LSDIDVQGSIELRKLADGARQRHDLFIGLVAPIGSSRPAVLDELRNELTTYGYEVVAIRLADLLQEVPTRDGQPLPTRAEAGYYEKRMDAGNDFREAIGDWSGLAAIAIAKAAEDRKARIESAATAPDSLQPKAYVFDSIKHPREAALLRNVYGAAFWLVALVQDSSERKQNLADVLAGQEGTFNSVPEARAVELISRDEAEPDAKHGQHVRDVFAAADFFLPIQRGVDWQISVGRLFRGIFDDPFLSPSAQEEAMRHARAAALRSAAIGRQVGAVVVPPAGTPFVLGTNEVPKPGGGQYREGDIPDHRDFRSGADPNPAYTERVIRELMERLASAEFFTGPRNLAGGEAVLREANAPDPTTGKSVLDGTRANSLIEFTRCLHAEQAAIVDAARTGVSIGGGRLYTTTFPCHECTKFIIGAGIVEVQYIEPYPKSLAGDLYRDLIDTLPPLSHGSGDDVAELKRVPFRPFLGFGPTRFDEVFAAGERRAGATVVKLNRLQALPVGDGWSQMAAVTRESQVSLAIGAAVRDLKARARTVKTADGLQDTYTDSPDQSSASGPT
jgi:deoxycytidylate deaminase